MKNIIYVIVTMLVLSIIPGAFYYDKLESEKKVYVCCAKDNIPAYKPLDFMDITGTYIPLKSYKEDSYILFQDYKKISNNNIGSTFDIFEGQPLTYRSLIRLGSIQ